MIIKKIINTLYIRKLKNRGMKIGKNCEISIHSSFGTEPYLIGIGDNVRITNGCKFFCHDGSIWVLRNLKKVNKDSDIIAPIRIGNNVNFGWNTMVLPGITIGDNVIIGAGSIVTKNIPSNSVVAGVPARKIRTIDEYCEKVYSNLFDTKSMTHNEKKMYLMDKFKNLDN